MMKALLKLIIKICAWFLDLVLTLVISVLPINSNQVVSFIGTCQDYIQWIWEYFLKFLGFVRGLLDLNTFEINLLVEILLVRISYKFIIYLIKSIIKFIKQIIGG